MLGTLKNVEKFDNISEFSENIDNKPKIEPIGNQSLKIILHCGCSLVQHKYCGQKTPPNNADENKINKFKNINSVRQYWVEFCKEHE